MKSLYMILAATTVVVTCSPQHNKNDIIWYPVDDEEGVFISTFGEKHRSSIDSKWRNHRQARYSGMEFPQPLPLSFDPTENQDSSFFHNINERRPLTADSRIPRVRPYFQNQQFPIRQPSTNPQGNQNLNENNFQEILNEVFNYNKNPAVNEYPGGRPGTSSQWGGRPTIQNQNQWGTNSASPIGQRPVTSNQWGASSSRPVQRPENSEWITQGNTNRPNRPTANQSDKLIFPGEASTPPTTTPSNLVPTDPPTRSPCERSCPVTPEFNPVCGSDAVTYSNAGRLKCAQLCGKNVKLSHYGSCGRTSLTTPLLSNNSKQKFLRF